MKSALGYVEETLIIAEIVKLLPTCIAPSCGKLLSRFLNSHKTFFNSLIPATEQRIEEQRLKKLGHLVPERVSPPNICSLGNRADHHTGRLHSVDPRYGAQGKTMVGGARHL
jgi:hypothetical protein